MLVKAKCPNCHKTIEIEESEFLVNCKFCGVPFMPREGMELYKQAINGEVMVENINYASSDIKNFIELGLASLKEQNHEKCGFYAEDILKRNPNSPEGLLLNAYYLTSCYSQQDATSSYFKAYSLSKSQELKDLILKTFINDIPSYNVEALKHLFYQLFTVQKPIFKEVVMKALLHLSTLDDATIEEVNITKKDIGKYFSANDNHQIDEYNIKVVDGTYVVLNQNGFYKIFAKNYCRNDVEKFAHKKSDTYLYNFYLDDNHVIALKIKDTVTFENLINRDFKVTQFKEGCYVATCVYGSYNAKEVRVLRNFRDEYLQKYFLGRLFIKAYYAISPTIVEIFKNNLGFHRFNKRILDQIVAKIENR